MKILVAEDDPTANALLTAALKTLGHSSVVVEDGQAALEALEDEAFPLVISDWKMPRLSGIELCRAVRAREARRLAHGKGQSYTYLILLTALGGKANYLEGMDAGADDLITKPFDPQQLAARLRVAERLISLLRQMAQLSGLLPICAYCKRIREGDAAKAGVEATSWVAIEAYVARRTEACFSHGVCPDCYSRHVAPQLEALRSTRSKKKG